MTDLLQRLRAVNPVPTCDPPTVHDVWRRLEHEDQVSRPATRHPATPSLMYQPGPVQVLSRPWSWLGHAGLGLAVAVPVLVAGLAIVLLGHNQNRRNAYPGRQPASPVRRVHSRPASGTAHSSSTSIEATLARRVRPLAPDANLALPILGSSETRNLKSFRGKVVVLNVFASWCTPCRAEVTSLQQAQAHIAEQATVLGVTYDDSSAGSEAFVRAAHITYPVLRDPSGRFVRSFGVTGAPETFVIDRLGRIAAVRRYQVSDRWLEQTLARVLASGGSAGQVSPSGLPRKSPPTASELGAMAAAYPVLKHGQQPSDIPPYGALDFYVLSQGALVANSRRAAVTQQGESLYIVPAHRSICVVSSDHVAGGCQPFPFTATTRAAVGATICAPNLPPNELEVAGLMPPDASDIKAHYNNGSSQPVTATNSMIAIYANFKGPLPTSITWMSPKGPEHTGTAVPPDAASSKCAS